MASIIYVVISSLILSLKGVCGLSISQQPVLNYKDQNEQIYDCIDFYKQPAFNQPSLNCQNSKMKPSLQQVEKKFDGIGLNYSGCPIGSVPILRLNITTYKDLHRSNTEPPENCIAVVQTTLDGGNRKFYGSKADLSLHKPEVNDRQWSSSRIKLLNGQDSIEAGWMVNPTLFKDHEARLYAKFQAGEKGCFNLECPGFVQMSRKIGLGVRTPVYSTIGKGKKYTWNISIEKHSEGWWVIVSNSITRYSIGYWPQSIFTSLADFANQIEWGGEINNPGKENPPPQMGNSLKARYDTDYSAFFKSVTVDSSSSTSVEPQSTKKVIDCPRLYTVLDFGYHGDYWGRVMFFGGFN